MNSGVKEYFDAVPESRKQKMERLHALVLGCFPEAVVDMQYRMPTYRIENGWVAIANQKNYISLYTCSAEHIKEFKERCPKIKTGKGCINFKENDEIPERETRRVIEHAMRHSKAGQP